MTPGERSYIFQYSHEFLSTKDQSIALQIRDSFFTQFPRKGQPRDIVADLMRESIEQRDGEVLECLLYVPFAREWLDSQIQLRISLINEPWHILHEELVFDLAELRDPACLDAMMEATRWIPHYMSYDDSRQFARKAIWAIGAIPGEKAAGMLRELSESPDLRLREFVQEQYERDDAVHKPPA